LRKLLSRNRFPRRAVKIRENSQNVAVLVIKIYRDSSRRLLALSQSTYLDKVLKRFRMENSKKGDLRVVKGISLSVTQSPAT
jgi:hypothetical protein